jgi:hypothetical protein
LWESNLESVFVLGANRTFEESSVAVLGVHMQRARNAKHGPSLPPDIFAPGHPSHASSRRRIRTAQAAIHPVPRPCRRLTRLLTHCSCRMHTEISTQRRQRRLNGRIITSRHADPPAMGLSACDWQVWSPHESVPTSYPRRRVALCRQPRHLGFAVCLRVLGSDFAKLGAARLGGTDDI